VLPAVTAAMASAGAMAEFPAGARDTQPRPDWRPQPPAEEPRESRRRRRLLLPLLALLVLAAVVVGGLRLMSPAEDAASTTAAPTTSATSSAAPATTTAAPVVQLVQLRSGDYVGRPVADVQAELTARGLVVSLRPQQNGDAGDGLVTAVTPVGRLDPNSPITVTYAVAPPPTATPTPTAAPTSAAPSDDAGADQSASDPSPTDDGTRWDDTGDKKGHDRGKKYGKG
jgi:serine/threonine-protein kinase